MPTQQIDGEKLTSFIEKNPQTPGYLAEKQRRKDAEIVGSRTHTAGQPNRPKKADPRKSRHTA